MIEELTVKERVELKKEYINILLDINFNMEDWSCWVRSQPERRLKFLAISKVS